MSNAIDDCAALTNAANPPPTQWTSTMSPLYWVAANLGIGLGGTGRRLLPSLWSTPHGRHCRMVDTAAWLTDRVLPHAPTRRWVLALPHRIRYLCAYDPDLCAGVRRIVVRAISSFYRRRAKAAALRDEDRLATMPVAEAKLWRSFWPGVTARLAELTP